MIDKSAEIEPDSIFHWSLILKQLTFILIVNDLLEEPIVLHFLLHRYWSDFLSCTSSAVAECQDDAVELWEKLKVPSGNLNYRGSLFQLCSKDNGAAGLGFALELVVCAVTVSKLVMWMIWE